MLAHIEVLWWCCFFLLTYEISVADTILTLLFHSSDKLAWLSLHLSSLTRSLRFNRFWVSCVSFHNIGVFSAIWIWVRIRRSGPWLENISWLDLLPLLWSVVGCWPSILLLHALILNHFNEWFGKLLWLLMVKELGEAWLLIHLVHRVVLYWAQRFPRQIFIWLSHHFSRNWFGGVRKVTPFKSLWRVA